MGANRQFDWLEISLAFNKSDKHTTLYDSYNLELAAKYIKPVNMSNFTKIYSLTNEKKYHMDNLTQKYMLYKQFVAWCCNGCSTAPMTDYINNPIYQELIGENAYDGNKSNKRIYLDLKASSGYTTEARKLERNDSKIGLNIILKSSAATKLRLRIWAHSIGEYLYVLSRSGLTLRHKTYSISQKDDDFLE